MEALDQQAILVGILHLLPHFSTSGFLAQSVDDGIITRIFDNELHDMIRRHRVAASVSAVVLYVFISFLGGSSVLFLFFLLSGIVKALAIAGEV